MKPFIPARLPITGLNWEEISLDAGRANRAVARYDGLLQGIPDAGIMLSPLTVREAVLSSKIEGTQATLGDVLQYDAGQEEKEENRRADIFEIVNYRAALRYAREALHDRPFSLSLLKELHQRLMDGVRGENKNPGAFRTRQNWIGLPGSPIEEAFFVPPPPHLVQEYLDNFVEYYHFEERDPLARLAVLHAQFEIIRPFDDGNGRLGRMIIPLFLHEKEVLSEPMFYLSGYLEKHRDEYIHRLRRIGGDSDGWQKWMLFFLRAVTERAPRSEASHRPGSLGSTAPESASTITRPVPISTIATPAHCAEYWATAASTSCCPWNWRSLLMVVCRVAPGCASVISLVPVGITWPPTPISTVSVPSTPVRTES